MTALSEMISQSVKSKERFVEVTRPAIKAQIEMERRLKKALAVPSIVEVAKNINKWEEQWRKIIPHFSELISQSLKPLQDVAYFEKLSQMNFPRFCGHP